MTRNTIGTTGIPVVLNTDKVGDLISTVRALAGHLTTTETSIPLDYAELITASFTDRQGPLRLRKSNPKGLDYRTRDRVNALRTALNFHSGRNTNLHGTFIAIFSIGRDQQDAIDTLATLIRFAGDAKTISVGAQQWGHALGVSA